VYHFPKIILALTSTKGITQDKIPSDRENNAHRENDDRNIYELDTVLEHWL
jgi:hypothetical protein